MRADVVAHAGCVPAIPARAVLGCAAAVEVTTPTTSVAAAAAVTATRNPLVTCGTSSAPQIRVTDAVSVLTGTEETLCVLGDALLTDRTRGDMVSFEPPGS